MAFETRKKASLFNGVTWVVPINGRKIKGVTGVKEPLHYINGVITLLVTGFLGPPCMILMMDDGEEAASSLSFFLFAGFARFKRPVGPLHLPLPLLAWETRGPKILLLINAKIFSPGLLLGKFLKLIGG